MEKSSFKIAAFCVVLLFLASDIEKIGTEARNVVSLGCKTDADCDLCATLPCTVCHCILTTKRCYCTAENSADGFFAAAIPEKTKLA